MQMNEDLDMSGGVVVDLFDFDLPLVIRFEDRIDQ